MIAAIVRKSSALHRHDFEPYLVSVNFDLHKVCSEGFCLLNSDRFQVSMVKDSILQLAPKHTEDDYPTRETSGISRNYHNNYLCLYTAGHSNQLSLCMCVLNP